LVLRKKSRKLKFLRMSRNLYLSENLKQFVTLYDRASIFINSKILFQFEIEISFCWIQVLKFNLLFFLFENWLTKIVPHRNFDQCIGVLPIFYRLPIIYREFQDLLVSKRKYIKLSASFNSNFHPKFLKILQNAGSLLFKKFVHS
jgi:hypothetical protein